MRFLTLAAAALATAVSLPALAQEVTQESYDAAVEAVGGFELSDTLYQNLWCGSVFTIIEAKLRDSGATADADSAFAFKDALFTKSATEAVAAGIAEADFSALSENFLVIATGQMTGGFAEADYTQEDCVAAAQAQ